MTSALTLPADRQKEEPIVSEPTVGRASLADLYPRIVKLRDGCGLPANLADYDRAQLLDWGRSDRHGRRGGRFDNRSRFGGIPAYTCSCGGRGQPGANDFLSGRRPGGLAVSDKHGPPKRASDPGNLPLSSF